jgi:hypothetical protein
MINAASFGGAVFCSGRSFPQGRKVVNPLARTAKSMVLTNTARVLS